MMWKWFQRRKKKKQQQDQYAEQTSMAEMTAKEQAELSSLQNEENFMQAAHADEQLGSTEMNANEQQIQKNTEQRTPNNMENFMKSAHADEQLEATSMNANELQIQKNSAQPSPGNVENFMQASHADEQLGATSMNANQLQIQKNSVQTTANNAENFMQAAHADEQLEATAMNANQQQNPGNSAQSTTNNAENFMQAAHADEQLEATAMNANQQQNPGNAAQTTPSNAENFMQAAHADEQLEATAMNANHLQNTGNYTQSTPDNMEHFMQSVHADELLGATAMNANQQQIQKNSAQTTSDNAENFMQAAHADEQLEATATNTNKQQNQKNSAQTTSNNAENFMQAAHADEQLEATAMNANEQQIQKNSVQATPDNAENFMKAVHADEQLEATAMNSNQRQIQKNSAQTTPNNLENFMKSAHADEQLGATSMNSNQQQNPGISAQTSQKTSSNQNNKTPASQSSKTSDVPSKEQKTNENFQGYSRPQPEPVHTLQELIEKLTVSSDFIHYHTSEDPSQPYWISYYRPSLDGEKLQKYLMPALLTHPASTLEELKERIPMSGITITSDVKKIEEMVLKGHAIVQLHEKASTCILANIAIDNYRAPAVPLNESTVIGPQEGFVEDIDTNLNLVRKRLPVLELKTKEFIIGTFSKTKIVIMYLENLADMENVAFLEESLQTIEYDIINDSAFIPELMGEKSIFPALINTERTDRVTSALIEGKLAIFVDGSPSVLLTPVSFFDFFISPEDYNVSWLYATFSRVLRLMAVLFSVCATPLYVAILSYHYELIPSDLLETLILSRTQVPFPPVLEALFLELAIDLLREAGARLPMKVGQTLGIVGGIVIGQASVEAGLTSNILLIFVALSALASFITPIYKMGNTIRLLRFPFLFFAEIGGLLGISIGFIFLFTHLFRLSSLRKPYALLYPMRKPSVKDSWIRFPLPLIDTRVMQARPQHKKKHTEGMTPKHTSDFDE